MVHLVPRTLAVLLTLPALCAASQAPATDMAHAAPAGEQTPEAAGIAPAAAELAAGMPEQPRLERPDIGLFPNTAGRVANPFSAVGRDLKNFFSTDTAKVFGLMLPAAGIALDWDREGIRASRHLSPAAFEAGNIGGGFLAQTGLALGTWTAGRLTGHTATASLGSDLLRAQMLAQAVTQAGKFTTRRTRPDGSDRLALPSGHSAGTFATATVLERRYGKRIGLPAYAFASYVAVARMSANRHHASDVILGAAVGIAAGRTVTVGVRGTSFSMGVAPTRGGAAVMFTKQ